MQTKAITLPRPHPAQQRIIDEARRFNVVNCGRRFGKTTLGINRIVTPETLRFPCGWFSPTYKMLREVWRECVRITAPITVRCSAAEHRIEFVTGGVLEFWSLQNGEAARGRSYRRIVVDEAALVANLTDVWQYVLRPALADMSGDAWFLSTPKGHNGFWQLAQWGQDDHKPDWAFWQMPTMENPRISSVEIEDMRRTMPDRVFRQEILAEFLEDAGGVFRRVAEAATAQELPSAEEDAVYVMGVDWGKSADFTVLTVLDVNKRAVVHIDRFNQIDYVVQTGRLRVLYERFRPAVIVAERNSVGEPLIEQLQREGLPVLPFTTTNASKAILIEALALAFERQEIAILPDPVLIGELQAYEMARLPSGAIWYGAPPGMHDDCVISLALAWHALSRRVEFAPTLWD